MLVIQQGEIKSFQIGLSQDDITAKLDAVRNSLMLNPSQIVVKNQTKGCIVTFQVVGGIFNIVVTNPDDEVFKL